MAFATGACRGHSWTAVVLHDVTNKQCKRHGPAPSATAKSNPAPSAKKYTQAQKAKLARRCLPHSGARRRQRSRGSEAEAAEQRQLSRGS